MSESKQTTDRNTIKKWADARDGQPAIIKGTESDNVGVLRIHFPKESDNNEEFKPIPWDKFFDVFEARELALLYQEKKENGEQSTFHKFVNR
ncbi:hypothetical protein JKA74_11080 [Marivirga sp. S37H4]|uniref:1,4-alpha-glucan branching enzyme n=1 Tax=Marivirga aurantiaca TaxID=2802615 RepID=A0A934WZ55_9BACT|nr:hypothetical protein [Marivirga aurantiaca]MBK6265581.1 hypothetical protein [Marivirga aurantiaca]